MPKVTLQQGALWWKDWLTSLFHICSECGKKVEATVLPTKRTQSVVRSLNCVFCDSGFYHQQTSLHSHNCQMSKCIITTVMEEIYLKGTRHCVYFLLLMVLLHIYNILQPMNFAIETNIWCWDPNCHFSLDASTV